MWAELQVSLDPCIPFALPSDEVSRLRGDMIPQPYLIFVGDLPRSNATKTALGVRDWAPEACLAQWRLSPAAVDLGLPDLEPAAAFAAGARSVLLGVAPIGGQLPNEWIPHLVRGLEAGLDLVSGLHTRLASISPIAETAARLGRSLYDVRHSDRSFPVATGRKRTGKRLLTVGTDCSIGKKYAALALTRALRSAGVAADFRATGQTGIMIAGAGIAIDAVIADFVAGAAEALSPEAAADHWDVIEGQGAIFHPAYAGVTLGLLHGSQPDALVLCHEPARREIASYPGFVIRPLEETLASYVTLARVTNSKAQFVAISLNTQGMPEAAARAELSDTQKRHGLPCFDPLRFGIGDAVERIMRL